MVYMKKRTKRAKRKAPSPAKRLKEIETKMDVVFEDLQKLSERLAALEPKLEKQE